ncbi:Ribosome-associated complex subunit SSZ1 [Erysiphe neolycopersici]|uniref:Ribosome-associated complex subunit SSZ1 n=1 Tax=Erysiphe neolycopersici TaxID=212602 RepID=A0A420HWT5_9PEZI|nr:Ribosome-associated complex subunit SSZ1 [Erysiphe neolycopersici]
MTSDVASTKGPKDRTVIGISFGNSNSSIAYTTSEGKVEVIANEDGDRQIPSILSYVDGEEYYGQQAKQQLIRNSNNTVAYFRDFLGLDCKSIDSTHCQASAHPQEHESVTAFKIRDKENDEESIVSISEIITRQISRLVKSAADYIGKPVDAAVITIPIDFSNQQRECLMESAKNGGIEVLQLIHEPIAALLAYDSQPEAKLIDKNVVVADFGGTRSDISVIASRCGIYTILATVNDKKFAGANLDQALIKHFANEFVKQNGKDFAPLDNPRSKAKLKLESEATKKALSIGTNASFSVESLISGVDFSTTINRYRYETIARQVFEGFNHLIVSAIEKSNLDILEIDEVILSGGTSHTPRIALNLQKIFTSPKTRILAPSTFATAINPSELQVRGAAIQANLIHKFDQESIKLYTNPLLTTSTYLSKAIGVLSISDDSSKGVFIPIIKDKTSVPARRSIQIATPREGGDVLIKIVEANSHIKVLKPEPKTKSDDKGKNNDESGFDSDSEQDEEAEIREKIWQVGNTLAEAALRGIKKGSKIEITATVASDLTLSIVCREEETGISVQGEIHHKSS